LFQIVIAMDLLWMFAAVAPFALALLFGFAAHIDPLSGRWRSRRREAGAGDARHIGHARARGEITPGSLLAADHH
jgi:hypothetical protein